MSSMFLLQIVVNLIFCLFIYILWLRLKKPPQDDPRLSRGLQLLQSKIAVLEDLSDRTEVQVNQLTALLEQKVKKVQAKIEEAGKQILSVEQSIEKSREVAKIFQDKIPHQEIIERQNTRKYVKAAKLAHEGKTAAEIAQSVDLPIGEIEFIIKVNKDGLMFDANSLPEWAKESGEGTERDPGDHFVFNDSAEDFEFRESDMTHAFDVPSNNYTSLKKLGDDFRQACQDYQTKQQSEIPPSDPARILESARLMTEKVIHKATEMFHDRGLDFAELRKNQDAMSEDEIGKAMNVDLAIEATSAEEEPEIVMPSPSSSTASSSFTSLSTDSPIEQASPASHGSDHAETVRNEFVLKKEEKMIRKVEFPRIDSTIHSR